MAPSDRLPLRPETWNAIAKTLRLSPQQKRIVELILTNRCDKEIAAAMRLRPSTIRTYLGRIFTRVGVGDRLGLVLLLFRMATEMLRK